MNKEALRQPEVHTTLVPISLTLICPLCSACAAAGRADAGASTGSGPAGEQAGRHRLRARCTIGQNFGSALHSGAPSLPSHSTFARRRSAAAAGGLHVRGG